MDYEKKYNEALEKARIINSDKYVDIPAEDTVLEYIFPELKESEDEKMLKAITKGMRDMVDDYGWSDFGGFPIDDILIWLEKQGEKPQGKSALEAAKSPKQEWSEEDVAYIDELTDFFEHCGELHQPQENVVKWLKSLKSRIGCEGYCTTK